MDDHSSDQGREATAVDDSAAFFEGAESLLNELSGVFDDIDPSNPPDPPADTAADTTADTTADITEEIRVTSPPRIEPPAMIWKPARRARFRFRR